jgi:hypothetical protein
VSPSTTTLVTASGCPTNVPCGMTIARRLAAVVADAGEATTPRLTRAMVTTVARATIERVVRVVPCRIGALGQRWPRDHRRM